MIKTFVRGLNAKLRQLSCGIHSNDFDVIGLTETWLSTGLRNSELMQHGYAVYQGDRVGRKGGDSLLPMKNTLNVEQVAFPPSPRLIQSGYLS